MELNNIIFELNEAFRKLKQKEFKKVAEVISRHNFDILGFGAGRMGYSLKAFIMRLNHLGKCAYMHGDTNFPRINENSLVLINSSSGETPSMVLFAKQAKDYGAYIVTFTNSRYSQIGKVSNLCLTLPKVKSRQIMKTIYEQMTYILFDAIALEIIKLGNIDKNLASHLHSISE